MQNVHSVVTTYLLNMRLSSEPVVPLEENIIHALASYAVNTKISSAYLAQLIGISESALQRCCSEFFGLSPSAIIRDISVLRYLDSVGKSA